MMDAQAPYPATSADSVSTLFDLLSVGAFRSTPGGRLLRANAALVRFHGAGSESELLASTEQQASAFYVDPARRAQLVERLERDGQVTGFVSEVHRRRPSERVWVTENVHVVRDALGQVLYYEGTIEEITDRVAQQAALRRSEQHLRLITEHIPGAVFRLHFAPDGRRLIDFVSGGVRALLGVEPEAMLAEPMMFERFIHAEDAARVGRAIAASVREAQPLTIEFRMVLADSTVKWVQMTSQPAPSPEPGQVRIGVMMDITDRKQAEALRTERDRAEAANHAKTELMSRVSHELRTPLNAVLGFAQLLESDVALGDRHRGWTTQILASGRHLLDVVDEVLDLAAAQAGRMNLRSEAVALQPVLAESWSMLAVAAARSGLRYEEHGTGGDALWVLGDARRLKQVLGNLLSNAVKYNRPGGRIVLRVQPGTEWVELRVADTGPGMTAEQLTRLFNPFERLGAQHTAVPGTGLGLALTRELVQAMGGRIAADSCAGEGTEFSVQLRRAVP